MYEELSEGTKKTFKMFENRNAFSCAACFTVCFIGTSLLYARHACQACITVCMHCISVCLFVCLFVCCMSVCLLSICPSVCLSVRINVCILVNNERDHDDANPVDQFCLKRCLSLLHYLTHCIFFAPFFIFFSAFLSKIIEKNNKQTKINK